MTKPKSKLIPDAPAPYGPDVVRLFNGVRIDDLPMTRQEAIDRGLRHYYARNPCRYGHLFPRLSSNDGCVECARLRGANAYRADPEHFRRKNAEAYERNAERCREYALKSWRKYSSERKAKARAYKAANRDKVLADVKRWRDENKDRLRESNLRWRMESKEIVAANKRRRRARKLGADGSHTAEDAARIREAQKGRCACCRKKLGSNAHLDHIVALSKGGSNWPSNLQWLCQPCNQEKHAKDPLEFMQSKGYLL